MRKKRVPRLLRVYLITYSAVLFIPTIVLALIINFLALPSLRSEMIDRNRESLAITADQINLIMDDLDLLANQISINPNLTPYVMRSGKSYEGLRILKMLVELNYTISDIVYYAHGSDKIFTSGTVTDIYTFSELFYKEWESDFFTRELPRTSGRKVVPMIKNDGSNQLAVIYPVGGNMSYLTLIFLLDRDSLASMIQLNRSIYKEEIFILDESNTPLLHIIPEENRKTSTKLDEISHKILLNPKNLSQYTQGKSFITVLDPKEGYFRFVSIIEKKVFLKPFNRIQWYFSATMLLIMAFGLYIIVIISRRQYDPIHRLAEKTSSWNSVEDDDEIAGIDSAIEGLLFSHKELQEKSKKVRQELRSRIIKDLISKNTADKISGTNLVLPDQAISFNCLVFKGDGLTLPDLMEANQKLEEKSPGKTALMDMEEHPAGFLIVTLAELDRGTESRTLAVEIGKILFENNPFDFGVGVPCNDLLDLKKSFRSACIDGKMDIPMESNRTPFGYDFDKIERLNTHIREGEAKEVQIILQSFVNELSTQRQSPHLLHYFLLDLSALIIKLVFDQEIAFTDIRENLSNLIDLEKIVEENQELKNRMILDACLAMCDCINENRKRRNRLLESVITVVEEKSLDVNFSVEALADELNVTVPYLSQYVRKKTGKTLVSQIWQRRLSEAQRLLENEDLPVKEVVRQVGYMDNSSFTRRFKKETGYSPQEYRSIHRRTRDIPT